MAEKSVFISKEHYPYFEEVQVCIDWFGGFALSQKRKCQIGLHKNFLERYPNEKVLEISSASLMSLGAKLSAMNLNKRTKGGLTSVESAFQSSRIYRNGENKVGPFHDYLYLPGRESKKLVKAASNGWISKEYDFDGMTFYAPDYHISLFYDFLYLQALMEAENKAVKDQLLAGEYTAFTDLATSSLNCQARSAAIFVGLVKAGKIDQVQDVNSYLNLFRTNVDGSAIGAESYENVQLLIKNKVKMLSPVVPCVHHKDFVENYYRQNCGALTNLKDESNYLDIANNS